MKISLIIGILIFSLTFAQEADSLEIPNDSLSVADLVIAQAISYLGVPYVWGGVDENGFDCSGLPYRVFNDNGIALPRSVTGMIDMGISVNREDLQPGDIMIFHNPTHTGIYIGNEEFIHCSSWQDRGVVITDINHSNYLRRYYSSIRVIPAQ